MTAPAVPPAASAHGQVKALYVLTFTPEPLEGEQLQQVTHIADAMIRAKDPAFKRLMEEGLPPKAPIEIANIKHVPIMHTPQTMQTTMAGWLKRYGVVYRPAVGGNFFPHGMRDPQGRPAFFLFYFDM